MKRRTFEHKMMNLIRAIHEDANKKGTPLTDLGEAFRHFRNHDKTEALMAHGSYKAIWESLEELRRLYGVR